MHQFLKARQDVLTQIAQACQTAHRNSEDVQLLAVSKTHPSTALEEMYRCGQRAFGENYLQEALQKIADLKSLEIEWHFIGHVQRNKTKLLAENFAWVHGVDRLIIAQRLSTQRPQDMSPLNICIQVNIDAQESKDGCQPNEVMQLVEDMCQLPNIHLRGLMVIPAPNNRQAFKDAQQLFDKVKENYPTLKTWDTLSMGMSGDLLDAVQAGSTMVRVGTALFGQRDYH